MTKVESHNIIRNIACFDDWRWLYRFSLLFRCTMFYISFVSLMDSPSISRSDPHCHCTLSSLPVSTCNHNRFPHYSIHSNTIRSMHNEFLLLSRCQVCAIMWVSIRSAYHYLFYNEWCHTNIYLAERDDSGYRIPNRIPVRISTWKIDRRRHRRLTLFG